VTVTGERFPTPVAGCIAFGFWLVAQRQLAKPADEASDLA
jgi:hypothetical protein